MQENLRREKIKANRGELTKKDNNRVLASSALSQKKFSRVSKKGGQISEKLAEHDRNQGLHKNGFG